MAFTSRSISRALRTTPATIAIRPAARATFRQQSRRGYADSATPKKSNNALLGGGVVATLAAVAGYAYLIQTPQTLSKDSSAAAKDPKTTNTKTGVYTAKQQDYQAVYDAIAKRLIDHDEYDDGSYGPVLVRLGWHSSGTYDKLTNTGGSNGATMRFPPEGDHGANAGLKAARDFLEPVKEQHPWISYSDLWTLAAVCAIQEMQGPAIQWRPGRSDRDVSYCSPDGRLPDGSKDHTHLRGIFHRMGFDDREIVALSGAHALGRCHTDRSGFDGPWTFSPTVLTNDYYKLLMEEKWSYKKWDGPKQFQDVASKSLMMLPTDMVLIKDKVFKEHVERYAKDNQAFFTEFSDVICKLFELGVPFSSSEADRMTFKASA